MSSCCLILLHCSENPSLDSHTQTPCCSLLYWEKTLHLPIPLPVWTLRSQQRLPNKLATLYNPGSRAAYTLLWQRTLGSVEQGHLPPPRLPLRHILCSEWLPKMILTIPRTLCSLLTSRESW